jgi:hypothetical protein
MTDPVHTGLSERHRAELDALRGRIYRSAVLLERSLAGPLPGDLSDALQDDENAVRELAWRQSLSAVAAQITEDIVAVNTMLATIDGRRERAFQATLASVK